MTRYSSNLNASFRDQAPRELLLQTLLGSPAAAQEAAHALCISEGWSRAFHTARNWSVLPQFADAVQISQWRPPESEWRDFKRAMIAVYASSASRASKGIAALRHLAESGVPAVAFKGLASMARLYSAAPGKRTIKDADLLIERRHLGDALRSLAAIGYAPLATHQPDRLESFLGNSPGFAGNKAIVLYGPDGFEIDLHWSLATVGLDSAALLRRSETVKLFATDVRIVCAEDGMILTARHAIRENLAIDTMCRDLFDIRQSCSALASRGSLLEACRTAAESKSLVPLLALTTILASLDPLHAAVNEASEALASRATQKNRRAARRLSDLFSHQVKQGPVSKDLLYLTHTRPVRQVLAGACTNWREYRDLMRSLEEKLEGGEVPLLRRLRILAAAIYKTGPAHLRSIRTLAVQKYAD